LNYYFVDINFVYFSSGAFTKTNRLVIVRHGESEFNLKNLFCGWHDTPLSEGGKLMRMITMTTTLNTD